MAARRSKGGKRRPTGAAGVPPGNGRAAWLLALLLGLVAMIAAAAVFSTGLDNPFVYDDRVTVVENLSIRSLERPAVVIRGNLFRPLVNLSYAVDYHLWGLQPFGFHLTSLLLHLLNVGLLMAVALGLCRDRQRKAGQPPAGSRLGVAFAAAALLAVHPLMSEAVAYISGRSELLCTGLLLLAFLALRRYLLAQEVHLSGQARIWLVLGLVFFVLALASKETAAMLPFLLLAWDRLLAPAPPLLARRRLLRFHLPFTALVVVAGAARVAVYLVVEGQARHEGLVQNLLTEAVVVWRYLLLLVAPVSQSVVHDVRRITSLGDPAALAAIAGLLLLVGGLLLLRRRAALAVFGLTWFLLLLAPSHLMPLQEAMAEHRIYTASCGFFLLCGAAFGRLRQWLAGRVARPRLLAAAVLVPLLVVLGVLTVLRLRVWSDPVSLWRDAATTAPRTWAAQYGLAEALRRDNRCAAAVPVYERAVAILAERPEAHLNLGICLAKTGQLDRAQEVFQRARQLDPESPKAYNNLATLALLQGQPLAARDWFGEAIRHDPMNLRARQGLVSLYEGRLADPAQALALCREIKAIAPDSPTVDDCIRRNQRLTGDGG